jgi:hypothetical protein
MMHLPHCVDGSLHGWRQDHTYVFASIAYLHGRQGYITNLKFIRKDG